MTLQGLKQYSLFQQEDTVQYGIPASSASANHGPLFIKKELNNLYNYVKVKFNDDPLSWISTDDYDMYEVVEYNGTLYSALAANSNAIPSDFPALWEPFSMHDSSLANDYVSLGTDQYIGTIDTNGKKQMTVGSDVGNAIRTTNDGLLPSANEISDLGTSAERFNSIFSKTVTATDFLGTSSSAKYADIAERYYADEVIEPGTVVSISGSAEIQVYRPGMSVAGVISTAPAYKMNDDPNEDHTTMPFVALKGKIPVKVSTNVTKGDYMLASDKTGVWQEGESTTHVAGTTKYLGEAYGVITMEKTIDITDSTGTLVSSFKIEDPELKKRFLGIALEDYNINTITNTVNIKV